ncbi:30S ribosomal protein S13 [archaeon]|mgnify:CR=1 FL=1|jgi:small subunit ribosomal protein S13|nr:30S ribosomal protein S13 [archaeon]MBT3450328.1 30S ribosomal protein S13 [archaeon]MBT6868897.1 30S ribosomal protein S13 [archaeon]MBT7192882.1 30S ribosomal protein S13 [archaeon]MBT7380848.1 30S ribosomal protein S13 [archaeon]
MGEENYKHIVRVANVDIPGNKQVKIALRKIKGVNFNFAHAICNVASVDIRKKAGSLTDKEVEALTAVLNNPVNSGIPKWMFNRRKDYDDNDDKHLTEGKLGFAKENDIKRLKKIKCLRGIRHQKGLPVRGQRTRSNFRRTKGKAVGVKKKR